MRAEYLKWLISIAALGIVGVALAACASPSNITPAPAPPRTFTATDLLIQANLLPNDWQAQGKPREYPAHTIGIRKALGGSDIDFIRFGSSGLAGVNQMIVPFRNAQDAAEGYQAHDYVRNTVGPYAITWNPIINFTYQSPLANQFRVVCGSVRNISHPGSVCTIEGQYEEFLSIVDYSTDYGSADSQGTVDDLETIARAIDAQMARYLEKDK